MKHFLPLTFCTVAVAGGLFLAVNAHHGYIHQLTLQNARTQASQAKAKLQAALVAHKQAQATQAKLTKLQAECKKGAAAYSQLTAFQKKTAVKPDCGI